MPDRRDAAYDRILARGEDGARRFLDALRRRGIAVAPDEEAGSLYAPNPVLVPSAIAEAMTHDLERFLAHRLAALRDGDDLLACAPAAVAELGIDREIATAVLDRARRRSLFAVVDAYLIETEEGLDRAYLEWQTFPAYPALALQVLAATFEAFPELAALGARPHHDASIDLARMGAVVASLFTEGGVDPQEAVICDVTPHRQPTRREFYACRDLVGGAAAGPGVIDPREVSYVDDRAGYQRCGRWTPIRRVMSRLVHDDVMTNLLPTLDEEQRSTLRRFLGDAAIDWLVHPLHFYLGSKADFPAFARAGLSSALVDCRFVTAEEIAALERDGSRLAGFVAKPVDGCGGRAVVADPAASDLVPGLLLQRRIRPAACHRTLAGPREPEVRVMGVPDGRGGLGFGGLFTRVKAPHEFRSNAGVTADAAVPGTGEGYGLII